MAVKQRHAEAFLERADLAAHRRLAQVQRLAGMGKAAGFGYRMEHAKLVPIHCHGTVPLTYSAAIIRLPWPARHPPARREISRFPAPPCSPCRRRSPPDG